MKNLMNDGQLKAQRINYLSFVIAPEARELEFENTNV